MNRKQQACIASLSLLVESGCTIRESFEALGSASRERFPSGEARIAIDSLSRGNGVSQALAESGILGDRKWTMILAQFEKTGNIGAGLALVAEGSERARERAEKMAGALAYPATVVMMAFIGCIFLLAKGVPLIAENGIAIPPDTISGMNRGIAFAIMVILSGAAGISYFSISTIGKSERDCAYWVMVHELSKAGIPLDTTLALCKPLIRAAPIDESFRCGVHDDFIMAMTNTARATGDYITASGHIARYAKDRSERLGSTFGKLIDPVAMAIAGLAIIILAVTVFLPILSFQGGLS
jgi:type II secretory pathway component PulF